MNEKMFYDSCLFERYKKRLISSSFVTFSILLALIILLVLSLVFVNRNNLLFIEIFSSISGVILITLFNYLLLTSFIPINKTYKHIKLINKQSFIVIKNVMIMEQKQTFITLSSGIKFHEVRIIDENENTKIYYLAGFLNIDSLPLLEKVNLMVCSSYIVGYKYEE